MKCPHCGEQDKDHVLDSRPVREGAAIKRRRECDHCRGRFTTFEEIEELRLLVIKSGGRARESFDRGKLRRAIEIACKKRPVSDDQISAVVEDLERQLYSRQDREVPALGNRRDGNGSLARSGSGSLCTFRLRVPSVRGRTRVSAHRGQTFAPPRRTKCQTGSNRAKAIYSNPRLTFHKAGSEPECRCRGGETLLFYFLRLVAIFY